MKVKFTKCSYIDRYKSKKHLIKAMDCRILYLLTNSDKNPSVETQNLYFFVLMAHANVL